MKIIWLVFFFLVSTSYSFAQLQDDFDDADLTIAPTWYGNLSEFASSSGRLKSNSFTANATFYISTGVVTDSNFQWEYDCQLLFNTSSLNYTDVFLCADSANLKLVKNGFFVRAGGSTDEISLFKHVNGVESKIVDGKDAVLNTSNNQFKIKVLYENHTLYLYWFNYSSSQWVFEGSSKQSLLSTLLYMGIKIRQSTSSFFAKHFFDDLYAGPIIKDRSAPLIDSAIYNDQQDLSLYFNEPVDTVLMKDSLLWRFSDGFKHPASVRFQSAGRLALLDCAGLPANKIILLEVDSLSDGLGNSRDTVISFFSLLKELPSAGDIVLTELMIDPDPERGLPNAEYIEILNVSKKYLSLKNCSITDPTAFKLLPDVILPPDSFLVLYQIPSLNNASDVVTLLNAAQQRIDQLAYFDSWYGDSAKSKGGYSLERIDVNNRCLLKENWTASRSNDGGTPGEINSVNAQLAADTLAPIIRSFRPVWPDRLQISLDEVFDTVTNSSLQLLVNTMPQTYKVIYQIPSQAKIELQLPRVLSDTGSYHFSIAGFKDCPGNRSEASNYLSQMMSQPSRNDIVINEILFNPRSGGHDFLEIYNRSKKCFDLSDIYLSGFKNGQLDGLTRVSKVPWALKPRQFVVLSIDTSEICQTYSCNRAAILCQLQSMPAMPDAAGQIAIVNLQNQILDSLSYSANWHFSLLNDQNGVSLERLNPDMLLHLQSNWHSAASVYGFATPGSPNSQVYVPVKSDTYFSPNARTISPDGDGFQDVFILHYNLPDNDYLVTISVFDLNGRLCHTILSHQSIGRVGDITWDGTMSAGVQAVPGIYILTIDAVAANGKSLREQISVILCQRF
jgi:hypothetical protein